MDRAQVEGAVRQLNDVDAPWLPTELSGCVNVTLLSAPGGDMSFALELHGGHISVSGATSQDAFINAEITSDDACSLATGKLEPAVAYMQGKLKPGGDMASILDLLAAMSTAEFTDWLRLRV